jgi:hypothetical protein
VCPERERERTSTENHFLDDARRSIIANTE